MPVDILLLDLLIVLAAARLVGAIARRLGQPAVIGEILAGILLGPTLLGHFVGKRLFPATVVPSLTAIADVGLVLFMFVVGMELDQSLVRGKGRTAASIALGSTLLPFAMGGLLALSLSHKHAHGKPLAFVLFLGASMSATAFPVLARIITDRGMQRTKIGGLALAAASVIDVLAWTVLAVIVAIAGAGGKDQWHIALTPVYAVLMFAVVRPLLRKLVSAHEQAGRLTPALLSYVLLGLVASAWATQWLNIHFIFGAFLFGVVMPREKAQALNHQILERLEQLAVLLLLPMFFVVSGLNVDLTKLNVSSIGVLAAILLIAAAGKLVGGYAGARVSGLSPRKAGAMAALVNTRGLTELVILTVGLQAGVLDKELYSLMVVMALVTTAMTGPLLSWIYPSQRVARDIAEAERASLGIPGSARVVAVLPELAIDEPIGRLAAQLAEPPENAQAKPPEVLLAHLRQQPSERLEVGLGLSAELAAMAEVQMQMEAIADRLRTPRLQVQVVSRFTDDLPGTLAGLVAETADPIVIPVSAPGHDQIRETAAGRVISVLAQPPSQGAVAVYFDGGTDAEAAVKTALRLAAAREKTLWVIGGKRAKSLAERLAGLGADVRTAASVPDGALVVAADDGHAPHLLVRAEPHANETDWAAETAAAARTTAMLTEPDESPDATGDAVARHA